MVRRTRNSIRKYYKVDLDKRRLKFPDVENPESVIYEFDPDLDKIFNETLKLIVQDFTYSRYTPLLYLRKGVASQEAPQKNMGTFMKILLLKRLESSFYAFKKSVDRFIHSHEIFISEYKKGNVYTSDKHLNKIFELSENDDDEAINRLIEEDKAKKYKSDEFEPKLLKDMEHDLEILKKIQAMWSTVHVDPKMDKFIEMLSRDKILKKSKVIVFTESKETAKYLEGKIKPLFEGKVQAFSSEEGAEIRNKVIDNYDPRARKPKDDIRILISTEILSEGVNLHRSNAVINYDIPWNPIRMMQRVGRINRVDAQFDKIYTYNFFPAGPINENISLKEAAEAKIHAFIEMLGNDARLLTDEEIKSHDLFMKLSSKKAITGEDEEEDHELEYLTYLRDLRDNHKDLFEKIKKLPKKARTARKHSSQNTLITFFRKGKLRKIFHTEGNAPVELDFFQAAGILKADKNTKKEMVGADYYKFLEGNKKEFDQVFQADTGYTETPSSTGSEAKLKKRLKAIEKSPEFTDEDEDYIRQIISLLNDGALPKQTIKNVLETIKEEITPLKILAHLKTGIPNEYFQQSYSYNAADTSGPKEVILSEYLVRENG
jgi:superfamily II DNA/RNA helicase